MNKCCTTRDYDFCTVSGHYVFPKKFNIPQATAEWELKFTVYRPDNTTPVEEWNVTNGKVARINPQTWELPAHAETLSSGEYIYVACYVINGMERVAFKGTITVKNHI